MIEFDGVTKQYGPGPAALKEISFKIAAGEMVFITGHSGAGKSTALRLLSARERPSSGNIVIGNQNTKTLKPQALPLLRRRIGQVFQDHRLLPERNVFENVSVPLAIAGFPRKEIDKRVRAALSQVGLLERENANPRQLSTGEQQRVGIARAIVAMPPVVIADEPTGNLDPKLALDIMGLFAKLNRIGITIIVASHDLHLIQRMKKRALVLDQGTLIDDFRPEAAEQPP